MTKGMRAALYLGPEQIELRTIPVPEPAAGELLVRVRAATTCGTDVKTYRRGHPKFPPPFIFGHEFAGDVAGVGEGVEAFHEGTRVTANVFAQCGHCFYCERGQGNLCENLVYNFGAFAEYMIIPSSIVQGATFEIPAHIPYAHAALVEPLATVVHGWHKLAVRSGETVAILGAGGPISLLFIQLLVRGGVGQVIAIGHSPARLAVAQRLGASHVMNAREQDPLAAVRRLTHGHGVDLVIECAGTKATWEASVDIVRRGGRVLWFGGLPGRTQVELDAGRLHYGEIDLLNMHGATIAEALEAFEWIVSGAINPAPLLDGELPLEKVELALKKMISGEVVKLVIRPDLEIGRNLVDSAGL